MKLIKNPDDALVGDNLVLIARLLYVGINMQTGMNIYMYVSYQYVQCDKYDHIIYFYPVDLIGLHII